MQLLDYEMEHLQALHSNLAECTVLLRSDGSFPLSGPCPIAAFGNGVRNTIKGGTGSGDVNSRFFVTVEEGLEKEGFSITTKAWLDSYDQHMIQAGKDFVKQVKKEAKDAKKLAVLYAMGKEMLEPEHDIPLEGDGEVCIYVLARNSGEGSDRRAAKGDLLLTDSERRDILELEKRYPRFMLVLNTGGPVDLGGLESVSNILLLSQLGVETGTALAEILLGKQNPSGKLATTWTTWEDRCKEGTFGQDDDSDYREGIYVGYRYFDSVGKAALFPFGHGLSYTEFKIEPEAVELDGETVKVPVNVLNNGECRGKEVVQVYVSCPDGKLDKPYQDLAAFGKTNLIEPRGLEHLQLEFKMSDLASFDVQSSSYVLEKGRYIVRIGSSSVQTEVAAVIELQDDIIVRRTKPRASEPGFEDFRPQNKRTSLVADHVQVLKMDSGAIRAVDVDYNSVYPIDEAVKKLSDAQLIQAGVGALKAKKGLASFIGDSGNTVAGTAGETTGNLREAGFKTIIMADGPAGLRIAKSFYRDSDGAHSLDKGNMLGDLMKYIPAVLRPFVKKIMGKDQAPKGAVVEHQYCTAIPIGTALAQSWNTDLARRCGDIVGDEMERFGVHLWLAPALNIHRCVLCGRNFEYFSEDPLVSGKMAAALTLGVQAHHGCGATIKHYAANSQETNRFGNSSNMSERTLREIYVKGFGICVREAQPIAVMTSYNLINGEHTAQSRFLIEDILRCEFGFQGLVMTDWTIEDGKLNRKEDKYHKVDQDLVAAAGGDLFMPGCQKDMENMQKGLDQGTLSREQLQINATRLYRIAGKLVD